MRYQGDAVPRKGSQKWYGTFEAVLHKHPRPPWHPVQLTRAEKRASMATRQRNKKEGINDDLQDIIPGRKNLSCADGAAGKKEYIDVYPQDVING